MNLDKKSVQTLFNAMFLSDEQNDAEYIQEVDRLKKLTKQYLLSNNSPEKQSLLAEFESGKPLTGQDGIRKKLSAIDLAYFGRAYFPHYFSRKSPNFHDELDSIWKDGVLKSINPYSIKNAKKINTENGIKRGVAAPRGHAKSTNLTFKDVLHAILYKYKHYILLLSDTYDQSSSFVASIKEELEDNQAIIEDFGHLCGKIWREDVLVTRTNIKLQAKGAGQKVRGLKHKNYRPDLIVLDDVENDELVRTLEQRRKLENWFYKAVSKCGDSYTDFIYIGTMLHYDSLLAKVLKNPLYKSIKYKAVMEFSKSDLWDRWESIFNDLQDENREENADNFFEQNKDEMLKDTKVLWEDKLSYYDLMKIKVSEGDASFNSELQNEPINPDDCLFNEEWFDYYNPFEIDFSKGFEFYGFVDPSLGKSKKSDFSAIITIAKEKETGYLYIEDADVERRHPDKIIDDILDKARRIERQYNAKYTVFGAEINQFQWFLKEQLAKESAKQGIYLPIQEVNQSSDKVMRIQTLQPDIKNKYIKFNKNHKRLLQQLKFFPMADHDDAPDALESCRSLATKHQKKLSLISKKLFGL